MSKPTIGGYMRSHTGIVQYNILQHPYMIVFLIWGWCKNTGENLKNIFATNTTLKF